MTHRQTTNWSLQRQRQRRQQLQAQKRSSLWLNKISSIRSIFIIVTPVFTTLWLLILRHSFLTVQRSSRSLAENTDDPPSQLLNMDNEKITIISTHENKNHTTQIINDKYKVHNNRFNDVNDIDNLKLPQWMKGKILFNIFDIVEFVK
jgi:hypothetical protein